MGLFEKFRKFLNDSNPDRFLFVVLLFALLTTFAGGIFFTVAFTGLSRPSVTVVEDIANPVMTAGAASARVDYSELMKLISEKKIKTATIDMNTIDAEDIDGKHHILKHQRWLYSNEFLKELVGSGIEVKFSDPSTQSEDLTTAQRIMGYVGIATQILFFLIFVGLGFFLFHSFKSMSSIGWKPKVVKSDVKFADVAGQDESKRELSELQSFLTKAAAYEQTGAEAPKGILLVGPPGTGKTLLAMALAGEASASFIPLTGSDFSNRFIGAGKERVETVFKVARKNRPCIIFIDEIDSVAGNRDGSGTDGSKEHATTLNKLLTEMDGFKKNEGIFVLAATNRIEVLDPAILRPGRFDRHIHVNVSDIKGREEILKVYAKNIPIDPNVVLNTVARGIAGFSGADIKNLVNEAAIHAARRDSPTVTAEDFEGARNKIMMGVERKSVVLDDADKLLIAVHESGHAVVAANLDNADPIHVATIIPRGRALGLVMQLPEKDLISIPKSKLLTRLKIFMGGRVAEELVFGEDEVTSGASSDIEEATKIATAMVVRFGMDAVIGMRKVDLVNGVYPPEANAAIQKLLDDAKIEARKIIEANRPALNELTQALLAKETIYGPEMRVIIGGRAAA